MLNNLDILQKLNAEFKNSSLDYLIIGGIAASYWGTPRFTADIDIVIEKDSLESATKILEGLGYYLEFLHPNRSFIHFSSKSHKYFRIDFMLVDNHTWCQLIAEVKHVQLLEDKVFPVVSPLHLIAMKLHAAKQKDRENPIKDISDVAEIMDMQMISLEDLEKNDIMLKHGSETTLIQLRTILDSKRARRTT